MVKDYTTYGSVISELSYQYVDAGDTAGYRFGFNGMEIDIDISGNTNFYTAEFWEFDGRLGRRWNKDPILRVWESPYSCFKNNPIYFLDPYGLVGVPRQHTIQKGENLTKIANQYKTTIENILEWNKGNVSIKNRNLIIAGGIINVSDPNKKLLIGALGQVGEGEDSESEGGNTGNKAKEPQSDRMKKLVGNDNKDGSTENLKDFRECIMSNIDSYLASDFSSMYKAFASRNGGIISNLGYTEAAISASDQGRKLKNDIEIYFKKHMIINNGNYSNIDYNKSGIDLPSWGASNLGLLTLVGGTQQLDVYISSITIHGNSYVAVLDYFLWDDFGVSESDILKADFESAEGTINKAKGAVATLIGCREGLVALWILQHQLGYKTLITGYHFSITISGSF